MLIGLIIFIILPQNYYSILISRCFIGLAFGCSYISSLFYISEIASMEIRSKSIFFLHLCLTSGMLLHAIFQIIGSEILMLSFCIILVILSLPFAYFKMLSSHIFLLLNRSSDSLERLLYFQHKNSENVHLELERIENHIIDEDKRRFNFFGLHNITALMIIVLVKVGYLSFFNILNNFLRTLFMKSFLIQYTETTALCARLAGAIVGLFLLDQIPKKWQFSLSAVVVSLLLFAFGSLLIMDTFMSLWLPLLFFLPIEFFIGIGLGGMGEVLKAEILPLKERSISFAVVCFIEEILHIAVIIVHYSWLLSLGDNPYLWTFIFPPFAIISSVGTFFLLKDSSKKTPMDVRTLYEN